MDRAGDMDRSRRARCRNGGRSSLTTGDMTDSAVWHDAGGGDRAPEGLLVEPLEPLPHLVDLAVVATEDRSFEVLLVSQMGMSCSYWRAASRIMNSVAVSLRSGHLPLAGTNE